MRYPLVFVTVLSLFSCKEGKKDLAAEEKTIRNLLGQERNAHFEKNTDLFISEFADSMISVNKGKVSVTVAAENKQRFANYFEKVNFIKWDDVAAPLVRFSDDGSMAYAVLQKQVIVAYPDSTGKKITDTTDYAWVSVYRKRKGEWKLEANISTNK